MKFATLLNSFQIHDRQCIVNYEINVGESHASWDWFNDEIFVELQGLFIPIIKEFLQGAINNCFNNQFDLSPSEYLAGSSFHVLYFFKKGDNSVNPCLIKCELENKYKPVDVSSAKLVACLCQTSHVNVEEQQILLLNQLKPYFGKTKLLQQPCYNISAYFNKTNVQNQIKTQAISSRDQIPLELKKREQTENHNKTDLISVCDPFISTQEDVKGEWSEDDFEIPSKEKKMTSNSVEFSKMTGTTLSEIQPNRELFSRKAGLNLLPKRSDSSRVNNDPSLSENVSCDFGEFESKNKLAITSEYKIRCVKDEECATVANEKVSKCCNPENIDRILSELEKPDPDIDRLVAEAKPKAKLASIFMRGLADSSSKDDSFDLTKTNKRFRKLKKSSVAKRKCDGIKLNKKVKCDNAKNKTLICSWKGMETRAITVSESVKCESDSGDSLPPAFGLDDEDQPSHSDVLENLSELRKLNGKETKECNADETDSDPTEVVTNAEKISVVKEMQNLTTDQLEESIEKNKDYLKEIFRGKSYCRRHQDYIKGGKTRMNLISHVFLSMYTDSQADFVMEMLMNIFCKHNQKYNDYVFKVLLTETLIKILMDYKDLSYDEAEKMSFLARYT